MSDLNELTRSELFTLASEAGLEVNSRTTKAELVEALEAEEEGQTPPPPVDRHHRRYP